MEPSFSVIIPNDRDKTYRWVAVWLLGMNMFGWFLLYSKLQPGFAKSLALISGILAAFQVMMFFVISRGKKKSFLFQPGLVFIFLGAAWLYIGALFIGFMMLGLGMLEFFISKPQMLVFTSDGIQYPSFPKKHFLWKDVENAMIKNHVLTIDLKDNRLFQFTLEDGKMQNIDETAFNDFCASKINN